MLIVGSRLLAQIDPERLIEVCGENPTWSCERVLNWTGSEGWANFADFLVGKPLRVLTVLVLGRIALWVVRRAINRAVKHATDPHAMGRLARAGLTGGGSKKGPGSEADQRASRRILSIGEVAQAAAAVAIGVIVAITVLGELGISLGPLLASAGIVGIALGFGAQDLVKDFLSGIFMLMEDQFGVGDIIDVGDAVGVVHGISLRTTTVRDIEGTMWHVPNGEIRRVGNMTQLSRALLDVGVSYSTDLDRAAAIIKEEADTLAGEPEWAPSFRGEPEIWGVQELGDSGIAIRLVIETKPGEQWKIKRQLNRRLKARFDREGIEIPFPQRTVWVRTDATGDAMPVIGTAHAGPRAATPEPVTTELANPERSDPEASQEPRDTTEVGRPDRGAP